MRVVTVDRRSHDERPALRRVMAGLRCGELARGCWMRPDNIVGGLSDDDMAVASAQCETLKVHPVDDLRALAHRLWHLTAWNNQARRVLAAIDQMRDALQADEASALAPGLVVSTAAIRHASTDPVLPVSLRLEGWVSDELRASTFPFPFRTTMST